MTFVSVCIPTRDDAPFLASAVASALAQDVPDLEVLVHDDASTDATPRVLAAFDDRRLRVLRHERAQGVAGNRNSCLAQARGCYVAWLDGDDAYLPGTLRRRLDLLEAHPEVALVHGGFEVVDEGDRRLPPWPAPFAGDTIQPGPVAFRELLASNTITTSTVVARRSAHEAAGPFSTSVGRSSTDWDLWLRIALRGDIAYTAAPVARYRQHEGTISRETAGSGERLRCDVRVAQRVLHEERRRIRDPREAAAAAHAALAAKALVHAGDLYTAGHRLQALRAIALAARLAPRAAGPGALRLLSATARGDDYGCYRITKRLLSELAEGIGPTRYASRLRAEAATEPLYEAVLARVARRIRRETPRRASVATVAKWDPTLLWLSGRRGVQFPDRRQLPDGYPRDDDGVIAHLELLR
ncbi:MAG: glycosyltransferase, partial [Actinomycetota bacterium]|nr:glycosyltransferase [Actinomycetota bacterium]